MIMPKLNINEGFDKLYNNKCSEDLHAELDVNYDDNVHEDNLEEYADNLFKHIDESEQNVVCSSKCYEMYLNRLNRFKYDKEQLESDLRDIEELAYKQMSFEEVEDLKNAYQFYIDKLDGAVFLGDSRDKRTIKRGSFKEPTVGYHTQDQINIEYFDSNINESKDLNIPKEILKATKNIEYNKITGTNDGSYYLWPMIDDLQNTKDIVKTLRSALPNYEIKTMIDTTSKRRKIRLTTVNDNLLGKIQDMFDIAASKQRLKLVNIQGNLIVGDASFEDLKKLSYSEIIQLKNWLELSIWDMNTHGFYLNPIEWINDRILSKHNLYIQVV